MGRIFYWKDLTWENVKSLDRDKTVIILPIGSTEQHSLHLPLGMDSYSVEFLAEDLAKSMDNVYILPPIYYGASEHHMDFDGTITLSHETLINLIKDIVNSLNKHGFKKIIILNGHGGNRDPINIALRELREETEIKIILINPWELIQETIEETLETKVWGHACEFETSEALWIIPEKVRSDRIKDPNLDTDLYESVKKIVIPWHTKDLTDTGSIGFPTKATKEKGEKLYKGMLSKTMEAIKRLT